MVKVTFNQIIKSIEKKQQKKTRKQRQLKSRKIITYQARAKFVGYLEQCLLLMSICKTRNKKQFKEGDQSALLWLPCNVPGGESAVLG